MTGTRMGGSLLRVAAALALLGLSGCVGETPPSMTTEPSFYRNLSQGGQLDPAAAQSMISGYRANNGLGAVTLDPALMKLAEEHSRNMAARDKFDHDVGKAFRQRIAGSRDSPPQRANMLKKSGTRMGIAAIYSPKSKYEVFWTLILAAPDEERS